MTHACTEVDDNGHTTSVMLSDDLAKTYVKFGKEEQFEMDPITVERSSLVPITPKRKAFQRVVSREYANSHLINLLYLLDVRW